MIIFLIAVVGIVLAYFFMIMPRMTQRRRIKPFLGIRWAHRGLHCIEKGIPENSMKAFKAAVREGYGIELDVHLTRDKRLVVFHDDTLKRVCGKQGKIEKTAYSELSFCYLSGTSERIPLFSEVLEYVNGRVPLLIEVKLPSQNTEVCARLTEELKGYQGAYLVQSFNSLALGWLRKHSPDILRGQLSSNLVKSDKTPQYFIRFCVKYLLTNCYTRPDFISYNILDSGNISVQCLKYVFRTPVAVWTITTTDLMDKARREFDMYIFERLPAQYLKSM